MNVLIFSTHAISVPFLGIELEILEDLKLKGYEIHVVKCDQKLSTCYLNPSHNLIGCAICQSRCNTFYKSSEIKESNIFTLEYTKDYKDHDYWFENLDELFDFTYDGINLGLGIASSLISIKRDYKISSHTDHQLINEYIKSSINQLTNIKNYINKVKPDFVLLFNGRFAEAHSIVEYCKSINLDYRIFEKGSNYNNFEIFYNSLPHSIKTRQTNMDKYWSNVDRQKGEAIANKWFHDKTTGSHTDNKNYLTKMIKGKLPSNFDPEKINIAIFNSSEDEFKAIREWQNDLYKHQNEAIVKIVTHFRSNTKYHFYLRSHPNLEHIDNEQTKGISKMDYPNLTVIPSSSSINSYDLMRVANKILGFGSSIIVESTYWNKPSILYGKSFYMDLDCVFVPQSFDELTALILDQELQPKDKSKTFKYAYFLNARGQKFKWFNWNGKLNSTFKGKKIKRFIPFTFVYLLKYMSNFRLWTKMNRLTRGRAISFKDLYIMKDKNVLKK